MDPKLKFLVYFVYFFINFQRQFICVLIGVSDNTILYENLRRKVAEHLGSEAMLESIEKLGLLENDKVIKLNTPLDTVSHYLSKKLVLGEHTSANILLPFILFAWARGKQQREEIKNVTKFQVIERTR